MEKIINPNKNKFNMHFASVHKTVCVFNTEVLNDIKVYNIENFYECLSFFTYFR